MIINPKNNKEIYICHFPGKAKKLQNKVELHMANKEIKVNENITVISAVNKPYLLNSFLPTQANLHISEDAISVEEGKWDMTKKVDYILEVLYRTKTKYSVILDCSDVVITKDLDETFLNKFEELGFDVLYNASGKLFPIKNCLGDKYIKGGEQFTYLNAGCCIGYTDKLIEWYEHCREVRDQHPFNVDEQFVIRTALSPNYNIGIDGSTELFYVCHFLGRIEERDGNLYIDDESETKNLNYKLQYSYQNLFGETIEGSLRKDQVISIGVYKEEACIFWYVRNVKKEIPKLKSAISQKYKNKFYIILDKKSNSSDISAIEELIDPTVRYVEFIVCNGFTNYSKLFELVKTFRTNLKYVDLNDIFITVESISTVSCVEFYKYAGSLDNVVVRFGEKISKKIKWIAVPACIYLNTKEESFNLCCEKRNLKRIIKQLNFVEVLNDRRILLKGRKLKIGANTYFEKIYAKKS